MLPYAAVYVGMVTLQSAWGALLGFHLALLPALTRNWAQAPLRLLPVSWRLTTLVALTGLVAGLGLWWLWPSLGIQADYPARVAALGLSGFIWLPFMAYFTLVNPLLEEAYWRGLLGSPSYFLRPVDFLFAGYHLLILALFVHWPFLLLAVGILALASWFWRQVSRSTGSLLPVVLAHALADLSILVVLYLKAI